MELSEARVVRFNWQRSGLSSAGRQRGAVRVSDTLCWCDSASRLGLFVFLRWRHELEGASIHHAVWLSQGNRYEVLALSAFTMFTTKQHLWFRKLSANSVQAALGPVALDLARSQNLLHEEQLSLAQNVLVISVLAIISTAPLGKWLNTENLSKPSASLRFLPLPRRFTYD